VGDPSLVLNCATEVTGGNRDRTSLGHPQNAIDQLFDHDNSYSRRTPGVYNLQMVGTHVNGSTLQLTSQVTIGGVGELTSIGDNIPVIK